MTLTAITLTLAAGVCLWTAVLAVAFLRDPARGLEMTHHAEDQLPRVMTGRYFALVLLALAALVYRDLLVIAVLYAGFAFMGFADAFIYRRAGKPIHKHISAGISALVVVILALLSLKSGATA